MIVALIDSGLGMLPTAAWLRKLRPELDLILALDPDGAPWGPKPEQWVIDRVLATAQRSLDRGAEVIVLPCNTASVTALDHVRELVGPQVPVVGTVPAIKPAAAAFGSVAVWATAATTASRYQADLIEKFGNGSSVVGVACHGLAEAIDRGERDAAIAAIASAAERTPGDVGGVVLGCTHYPLMADEIAAQLPAGVRLFDSAEAVAAQTLRRIDALNRPSAGEGTVEVFLSGRPGRLPASAEAFPAGQLLAAGTSQPS
ncbi:glutamate racemase [Rhodococcus sp. ACS1]|uniref:Glutamate racemase n=1 Tax=Rhodococcus koreensis TaxID=99653 RepID=A0A1H4PME5_9NOCA|nr:MULTISPECIES: aspartate/glutamate racemase family protein [Rhodococcus]PBC53029.1 glutamate racemase [Rhodococcus sp. ACS1]QSE83628.1 aspartate/glutamate racemase family protein [Rhodococcus koreensis]SEC08545.1 glutamate racemase [Rhodococcus koreensis]